MSAIVVVVVIIEEVGVFAKGVVVFKANVEPSLEDVVLVVDTVMVVVMEEEARFATDAVKALAVDDIEVVVGVVCVLEGMDTYAEVLPENGDGVKVVVTAIVFVRLEAGMTVVDEDEREAAHEP